MLKNYLSGLKIALCLLVFIMGSCVFLAQANGPIVKITNPIAGDVVSDPVNIKGTIIGEIPKDHYLWILVNPEAAPGLYWPQGGYHVIPAMGLWSWQVYLGGNSGNELGILAVLVDEKTDQMFVDWDLDCQRIASWPGLRLPDNVTILDQIKVIRE